MSEKDSKFEEMSSFASDTEMETKPMVNQPKKNKTNKKKLNALIRVTPAVI